ncbi:MAG: hypothetical protein ACE5JQ_17925 [Candidatus Methylomirabilales bacterium]
MPTLTFSVSPTCAGGNHYEVTFNLGAQSVTMPIQHADFEPPMTNEEKKQFLLDLLRFIVGELSDRSVANVRAKLASGSLTLEL